MEAYDPATVFSSIDHGGRYACRSTRIALNLLKHNKSSTLRIKGKRLKAGWDNDCLLHVLGI